MAYGDHTTAYSLLFKGASESEIQAAGEFLPFEGELGSVVFADKSSIELRRFNNHQAFLSNGWNITPRR